MIPVFVMEVVELVSSFPLLSFVHFVLTGIALRREPGEDLKCPFLLLNNIII